MERNEEGNQAKPTRGSQICKGSLAILLVLSSFLFPVYASSTTINPGTVPFVRAQDVSGQVTAKGQMVMASWAECADQPKPASVLGIACNNGSGNDTIVMVLHPFELQQLTYIFNVTTYANATGTHVLDLRFVGNQPARIIGTTIASKTYNFGTGIEDVTFNLGSSDPSFTLLFFSAAQNLANAAVYASGFFALVFVSLGLLFFASIADQSKAAFENRKPFLTTRTAMVIGVFTVIGWAILIIVAASVSGTLAGLGI